MSFEAVAEDVRNLAKTPSDAELLEGYSLYKQATAGDCNTAKPGALDLKAKAKWEAWNNLKGMSQDDAKQKYIAVGKKFVEKYGVK